MLKARRDGFVSVNFSAVLKPLLEAENRAISPLLFFLSLCTIVERETVWNDCF